MLRFPIMLNVARFGNIMKIEEFVKNIDSCINVVVTRVGLIEAESSSKSKQNFFFIIEIFNLTSAYCVLLRLMIGLKVGSHLTSAAAFAFIASCDSKLSSEVKMEVKRRSCERLGLGALEGAVHLTTSIRS